MRRSSLIWASGALLVAGSTGLALAQAPVPASSAAPAPPAAEPPARPDEEPPPAAAEVPAVLPATPAPTPSAARIEMSPVPDDTLPKVKTPEARAKPEARRALHGAAILQALDKVTAETLRFEAPLNQPIRYKGLIFTVRTCVTTNTGQDTQVAAHMLVQSQPIPLPGRAATPARNVYRGWMYADAPGLHPLEHPVYDAWLVACKTSSGPAKAARR